MILRSVSPELIVEIAKERHHYGYSYFFLILALVMLRADNNDNFDKPLCQHIYFALLSLSLKSLKSLHAKLGLAPLIKSCRLISNSSGLQFGVSLDKTLTLLSGQH